MTAASQMLRRSSPSALTYRALGKKAGLPHSTIEYHFPTREDLLMEAASLNVEVWVDRARKIRDEALQLSPQELRDKLPEFLVAAVLPQAADIQYIRTYQCTELGYFDTAKHTSGVGEGAAPKDPGSFDSGWGGF